MSEVTSEPGTCSRAEPTGLDQVVQDAVVTVRYAMTGTDGTAFPAFAPDGSHDYLHGHDDLVPGLEQALEGRAVGERVQVEVPPALGYGERQRIKPQRVPRSNFPEDASLEVGAQYFMEADGETFPIFVVKVMGRQVHVSPQHPLAGVTLRFDCTVEAIRPATAGELEQGWPSEGGCGCC
ncbi:MAG: peptidylprolyl isomerase [Sandaracinaceae bacterium]